MIRSSPAFSACPLLLALLLRGAPLRAVDEPVLRLENVTLSADVTTFDLKVLVTTEAPLEPVFIIGIGWDPSVLDLVEVNFAETVFELNPPPFWDPEKLLNLVTVQPQHG